MQAQELSGFAAAFTTPHIKPNLHISEEEYMQDRVIYKIFVYDKKGKRKKLYYQLTSFSAIVLSAAVPVLINLNVLSLIPTLLSLAVTILVSSEKLFHFREHWKNYDSTAAQLRSEQLKFQTNAGNYKKKENNEVEIFRLFVNRVEDIIREERADTIEMRTTENTLS